MKVNSYDSCIFTPVKNDDSSKDLKHLNKVSGERSSPSPELRFWLERIDRLHRFRHSPAIECIESFRLKFSTRNEIRQLFEGFDEEISDWIHDIEKDVSERGKFSAFIQSYIHYEFRVKKDYSFCIVVILNYMKKFSVGAEAAFLDVLKLNAQQTVCSKCSESQDSSGLLVQRINLDYVRKLILSEGSDSLLDSDSDPEFVLKKTCQDQVESSTDTSSDNDVKVKPKKRTPVKVVLNENEDSLCNPFISGSDSSASNGNEMNFCNPFHSDNDLDDEYRFDEGLALDEPSFTTYSRRSQSNISNVKRTSSVKVKSQVKSYICYHCERKFLSNHNLKLHLVQVHRIFPEGMKIYRCPEPNCQFVTGSRICYNRHAATHLRKPKVKVTNLKISCSYCPISVANRSSLKRHHQRKHS
jgi:hypothetical protein